MMWCGVHRYIGYGYKDEFGYSWGFSLLHRVSETFGGLSLQGNFQINKALGKQTLNGAQTPEDIWLVNACLCL